MVRQTSSGHKPFEQSSLKEPFQTHMLPALPGAQLARLRAASRVMRDMKQLPCLALIKPSTAEKALPGCSKQQQDRECGKHNPNGPWGMLCPTVESQI
ncbi:hypothetical protein WJX84_007780 [Apatococcus fuscideae]|uniref:Uncharacterized protein n=1 Tax=Apatococcus fuscideae TaxID=2026836 RepID=A0AAW1RQK3_9CHLO